MYAVIKTGGKQYRVKQGDILEVEKLNSNIGDNITLDQVLMVSAEQTQIGTPLVLNASVEANIVQHMRAKKVMIIKFRRRKHSMKRQGHRQNMTKIKITKINT